ncbi:MAG TPA: rhodanese-like domain-containing protein [Nitrospirota bacterium]|nr:rhodanese-like domain-containing protein [Nitrospirota bacterium]
MKKAMWSAVGMLALSLFLYAAPVIAEDEGDGDFVSAVAPKGKGTLIPPGHFGIVARYADELLSVPACPKTNWNVIAMGLFDGVDDPTLADEITDFFVVDTRTTAEYCAGHLPVAVNIPVTELAKPYSLAVLPMDKPILLI